MVITVRICHGECYLSFTLVPVLGTVCILYVCHCDEVGLLCLQCCSSLCICLWWSNEQQEVVTWFSQFRHHVR